jgi:hypothetical protein
MGRSKWNYSQQACLKFILNVFTQGFNIRMCCGMDRIGSLGFCSENYSTYILMGSLPIIVSLLSLQTLKDTFREGSTISIHQNMETMMN